MGNCVGRTIVSVTLPEAPLDSNGRTYTNTEVKQKIKDVLGVHETQIKIGDRDYFGYGLEDLERFLSADFGDKIRYRAESFDCDDFSYMMMGKEKVWYGQRNSKKGSTFGIVWGDIRNSEDDEESRPHAVNFFIDKNNELWLMEPQSDKISKPTTNSTFWFAIL